MRLLRDRRRPADGRERGRRRRLSDCGRLGDSSGRRGGGTAGRAEGQRRQGNRWLDRSRAICRGARVRLRGCLEDRLEHGGAEVCEVGCIKQAAAKRIDSVDRQSLPWSGRSALRAASTDSNVKSIAFFPVGPFDTSPATCGSMLPSRSTCTLPTISQRRTWRAARPAVGATKDAGGGAGTLVVVFGLFCEADGARVCGGGEGSGPQPVSEFGAGCGGRLASIHSATSAGETARSSRGVRTGQTAASAPGAHSLRAPLTDRCPLNRRTLPAVKHADRPNRPQRNRSRHSGAGDDVVDIEEEERQDELPKARRRRADGGDECRALLPRVCRPTTVSACQCSLSVRMKAVCTSGLKTHARG